VIPYGNLQHLTPQEVEELANTRTATGSDGLAGYVSSAESSAAFLKEAWNQMKAAGGKTPPPANSTSANLPHLSLYSFRYLWAGEFYLLVRQLASLPKDVWSFYMDKAGRSGASHSYMTYMAAYVGLFASRVRYVTDVGRSLMSVSFKTSMYSWSVTALLTAGHTSAPCLAGHGGRLGASGDGHCHFEHLNIIGKSIMFKCFNPISVVFRVNQVLNI